MRRKFAAGAGVKRFLLRIVLVLAVFWGGGLALFSIMPVPFSAVMVERQLSAWFSGDFSYVAHSDWVSMDEISPFIGAGGHRGGGPEIPGALGIRRGGH